MLELKVVMDMENLTSFELTINNWDDQTFAFKYSDTHTFDVGNRVHVQLGYADRLRSMMRGHDHHAVTPRFPESGQPTIGVTGSTRWSSCATASRARASCEVRQHGRPRDRRRRSRTATG